jgi:arabinogalactan endo-1,4-beta-galactosidase
MRLILALLSSFIFATCGSDEPIIIVPDDPGITADSLDIRGLDISDLPKVLESEAVFFNESGQQAEFLDIIKEKGVNTIRLRLWVNPADEHSSLSEVVSFSEQLKAKGFRVWLCLHYSDSWADPDKQFTPAAWEQLDYETLKDTVYQYSYRVIDAVDPYMVQIGNEINAGFLHPEGERSNLEQFKGLLEQGIAASRAVRSEIKIMLHYAGYYGAGPFFEDMNGLDYDQIGLSYYPIFHGKNLATLALTMSELSSAHEKDIIMAETSYPFTLGWNDWTNNLVGLEDQLLNGYPATPNGQMEFIARMKELILQTNRGIGLCYWGAELIAFDGEQSSNGSSWENQAVFDFENKVLPVLDAF